MAVKCFDEDERRGIILDTRCVTTAVTDGNSLIVQRGVRQDLGWEFTAWVGLGHSHDVDGFKRYHGVEGFV